MRWNGRGELVCPPRGAIVSVSPRRSTQCSTGPPAALEESRSVRIEYQAEGPNMGTVPGPVYHLCVDEEDPRGGPVVSPEPLKKAAAQQPAVAAGWAPAVGIPSAAARGLQCMPGRDQTAPYNDAPNAVYRSWAATEVAPWGLLPPRLRPRGETEGAPRRAAWRRPAARMHGCAWPRSFSPWR